MKRCCRCKLNKDTEDFGKNAHMCKICSREYNKEYRKNNLEKSKKAQKVWYEKNREKVKEYRKEYKKDHPEKLIESWKKSRIKRYEKRKINQKNYIEKNRKQINEYAVNRRKNNSIHKISHNIRGRIRDFLKSNNMIKTNKTFEIIGCTPEFLKDHLENQFMDGMSWENYGYYGWHIDHIIPLYCGKTEDEIYNLCHYINLQPLWRKDNQIKNNKI